jgi:hypothetical protein
MTRKDGDLVVGAVSSRTLQHFCGLRSSESQEYRSNILRVLETDQYDSIKAMMNEHAKPNAQDLGQALKEFGAPSDCKSFRWQGVDSALNDDPYRF